MRLGRQSEGLRKYTEEQVEGRCFSIIFKGHHKNLDLIASSEEEARQWVNSLQKVISNMNNLNRQEKTEQYPWHHSGSCTRLIYIIPQEWSDQRIHIPTPVDLGPPALIEHPDSQLSVKVNIFVYTYKTCQKFESPISLVLLRLKKSSE